MGAKAVRVDECGDAGVGAMKIDLELGNHLREDLIVSIAVMSEDKVLTPRSTVPPRLGVRYGDGLLSGLGCQNIEN
jgi:hypothetical protein